MGTVTFSDSEHIDRKLIEHDGEFKVIKFDIVLSAIEHELARREWHERLAERPVTDLGDSAASLLAEERQKRRHDLA